MFRLSLSVGISLLALGVMAQEGAIEVASETTTPERAPAAAAAPDLQVREGDQLLIQGRQAQVIFNATAGNSLRISGLDGPAGYHWERVDRTILIKTEEPAGRKEWKDKITSDTHKTLIEISGPALPVEVQLREGSVTLNRWPKEARINLRSGRVQANSMTGPLRTYLQKGDITLNDYAGKLAVDVYQGTVNLKNLNADAELRVFNGTLNVEGCKGNLQVFSQSAVQKLAHCSGTLQIDNGKGNVSLTAFQGRVEGVSGEGPLTLQLVGESDVSLKTRTGRVSVQLPPQSGATLNLATVEGEINAPGELKVVRGASEKTLKGRLKGEAGRLSVSVRSQEGSIVIR